MIKTFAEAETVYLEQLQKRYQDLIQLTISDSMLSDCEHKIDEIRDVIIELYELKHVRAKVQVILEIARTH